MSAVSCSPRNLRQIAITRGTAASPLDKEGHTRSYTSPQAFKQALEQRLRTASTTGADFARRRQLLVFDRFLARVVQIFGDAVLLKGGLVLELRLERARATKDVDLRMVGPPDAVLASLQDAGRRDHGDFMAFEVSHDPEQPAIKNDGMQYEGLRFRAECRLAGKLYGQPFGVDVAFGDPIVGEPEIITADDVLAFAGISPPELINSLGKPFGRDQARSKRSAFITLVHAATKSATNFASPSSAP